MTVRTVPKAYACVRPPRVRVTELDRARAESLLPGLENIELHTRDGLRLVGWFSPGRGRSGVVLIHGLGANRAQLLPEAAVLARRGHGVLLFDSRHSGDSQGQWATWGDRERLDLRAALDLLSTRPDVDPSRLGVYGFSVGATPAALVAADDLRVRAVALGPTWPSAREELADDFRWWHARSALLAGLIFRWAGCDLDALRPIDVVGRIPPRPLLLLSGARDSDTPPAVMDALLGRAPGAERWVIEGAGHGGYVQLDPDGFDRRFGRFFDRALLTGVPGAAATRP